jgi:hypothetical protein
MSDHSVMFERLATTAVALLTLCGSCTADSPPSSSEGTVSTGTSQGLRTPAMRAPAVPYLRALKKPLVAEFLERSTDVAEGRPWRKWESSGNGDPACTSLALDDGWVRTLDELKDGGEYSDALMKVDQARANAPDSCFLHVERADLIRLQSEAYPTSVPIEQQARAIADLIELASDRGALPLGSTGKTSVFVAIGDYFAFQPDPVSELTAYLIARDLLDAGDVPDVLRPIIAKDLEERIARLSKRTLGHGRKTTPLRSRYF